MEVIPKNVGIIEIIIIAVLVTFCIRWFLTRNKKYGVRPCPDCERKISLKAKYCPGCGRSHPFGAFPFWIVGIVIALLVFGFVFFVGVRRKYKKLRIKEKKTMNLYKRTKKWAYPKEKIFKRIYKKEKK